MHTAAAVIAKRREVWELHHSIEKDRAYREAVANYLVSVKGEALREEIKAEPRLLIEMVFVIVDKAKQTVPFFLNKVQRGFSDDLYAAQNDYNAGLRLFIRFLVLKGRQQGFTAYITAEQLARSIITRNFAGFTVANKAENTATIFQDKAKFTYDNIPEALKPTEKFNNRQELHFDKLNSRWRIATAAKDVGISKTLNFVHFSEAAFFEIPISSVQASLGDSLTPGATEIWESTANGYNEFKDAWDSGSFDNKFYEWWLTDEYATEFESEAKREWFTKGLAADYGNKKLETTSEKWIFKRCQWLIRDRGLSVAQAYWYYNKWDYYGNKELIKQQFPCSADEAFLASGRCVFDKEKVIERKECLLALYAKEPPKRGMFRYEWNDADTHDYIKDDTVKFVETPEGMLTIYEDVKVGHPYVIGGDTKGEGKDFYSATVIDNVTGKRVATLRAQLTNSKPFTWQLYCLAWHYNMALVGVEMNFNTAPIEELERLRYPRQYTRQQYDSITKQYQKKYGWKTDGNTRPLIIDKEVDLIENNIELFTDITFLDECLTFVYDDNGRPDAESGKHDDVLFSDMIANEIRTQQSFVAEEIEDPDLDDYFDDERAQESWFN